MDSVVCVNAKLVLEESDQPKHLYLVLKTTGMLIWTMAYLKALYFSISKKNLIVLIMEYLSKNFNSAVFGD